MSDWSTLDAAANAVMQQSFGEPVVYQSLQAGVAVAITAIRHARLREESGVDASFEEISVNPADFESPPAKGDQVTAWGTQYVVTAVRQPDAYGMIIVTLLLRA